MLHGRLTILFMYRYSIRRQGVVKRVRKFKDRLNEEFLKAKQEKEIKNKKKTKKSKKRFENFKKKRD
jgi:hypothetical protein